MPITQQNPASRRSRSSPAAAWPRRSSRSASPSAARADLRSAAQPRSIWSRPSSPGWWCGCPTGRRTRNIITATASSRASRRSASSPCSMCWPAASWSSPGAGCAKARRRRRSRRFRSSCWSSTSSSISGAPARCIAPRATPRARRSRPTRCILRPTCWARSPSSSGSRCPRSATAGATPPPRSRSR